MKANIKLTRKQEIFVKEYLVDLNATQSAIRAGYSKKTAQEQGSRLLSNVMVMKAIEQAMEKRARKVEITAEYVLKTIYETIERCKQAEPVLDRKGENVVIDSPSGLALAYQFEANAVLKGAELLGKHLKMFTEKTEIKHEGAVDVFVAPKLTKEEWLERHKVGLEDKK